MTYSMLLSSHKLLKVLEYVALLAILCAVFLPSWAPASFPAPSVIFARSPRSAPEGNADRCVVPVDREGSDASLVSAASAADSRRIQLLTAGRHVRSWPHR